MFETIRKPWFFVFIGVMMTITSAIITNFFIVENNKALEKYEMTLLRLEKKIDQTWENSKDMDRLEETGTMLLLMSDLVDSQSKKNHAIQAATRYFEKVIKTGSVSPDTAKEIKSLIAKGKIPDVLDLLFRIIDSNKQSAINNINDTYIEKAALERQKIGLEDRNDVMRNIALFLQIMGLILVLSNGTMRGEQGI